MTISPEEIVKRFTHHPAKDNEQTKRYAEIRETGKVLAQMILRCTPESREQSLAITSLEEAVMWTNAAIARRT